MSIRVAIHHHTSYDYARPAFLSPQVIRLRPAPHNRTPIHSYSLHIEPEEHYLNWLQDPQGNHLARVVFPEQVERFSITVDLVADLAAYNPFDYFLESYAEKFPFDYAEGLKPELAPYLVTQSLTPKLAAFVETIDRKSRGMNDFLVEINQQVKDAVDYVIRMEHGVQTPEQTLELAKGSCRDSGWLLVQVLRHLGLAARFVSGYLVQLVADERPVEGPTGPEKDFTDLHAWCEVFVPGAGWVGLDPTSGLLTAEGHIPLACTPAPASAAPIEGAAEKVDTEFGFDMTVTRIIDVPRVTKPYDEEQWQKVLDLGQRVDADLQNQDVRLTMGGEPTFVSIEDPDEPEWNTAALGGKKETLADTLLRKLRQKWKPGSLIHHGQGKWYPGEQLPRWAMACYFRADGVPIWTDADLIAGFEKDYGHTAAHAEKFARRLTENLGLEKHGLVPAYEDVWYYLWRERRLPTNVDPLDAKLDDEVERARLAKVFQQGLGEKVGWLLPLGYRDGWVSGEWFLRNEHCFLLPGDSPMGLRLPLDSIPWVADVDYDGTVPPDPFADPFSERAPLPQTFPLPPLGADRQRPASRTEIRRQIPKARGGATASNAAIASDGSQPGSLAGPFDRPLPGESATGITRSALCVEPRDGCLRVFMPPLDELEQYLELVAAIEKTARDLSCPVQVEGYGPPFDPRISVFKVTPDPGVIEVNVPPVSTWAEIVEQTESLYETARHTKLAAEKFDIDGTHIGSGGGNHMVLGGATPGDSPFLRRPDVLASLIAFWHNHPSLSYLFSGRFIGPTSQAPRVDEARDDMLYELELAFRQIPEAGTECPPWLIDRLLRNLLVDVTGNTHRSEFCIDKLYSPDSATGRLGLVEFRAFEMPPHARMSAVQQLFLRSLVSAFWRQPYRRPLTRWGTSLHDKWLLPYFIKRDMHEVLRELASWGYELSPELFEPHYQFRFPFYGTFTKDAMRVELRGALEPWHVLGEESAAGAQARYVDSSVERMQVRAFGLTAGRHIVTVNGYQLPLRPTGTETESVCGVRYRAWQPPSALHPNIPIDSPLHFDLYDTWNRRAIDGCTYHVIHPGGRADEVRPVNAAAAESRRIARFQHLGHVPGFYGVSEPEISPEFPRTLDLRYATTGSSAKQSSP